MAYEYFKESMIMWAHNIGYQILLSDWQSLWKNRRHLMSISYKENCYRMCTDGISLLQILQKCIIVLTLVGIVIIIMVLFSCIMDL